MLLEMLSNLADFNIGYFTGLATGNLVLAFGIVSVSYFFSPKDFFARFVAIIIVVSAMMDLQHVHNFIFYSAAALFLLMLARMVFLTISESNPGTQKYSPLLFAVATYAVLFYINFFG